MSGQLTLSEAIISFASCIVVIFITLPIHEWAHGFLSTCLGDPTPRYQGRLTLNPLAHIDWLGALAILTCGIGWAKPVQVNARYYKSPKWGMALVALAGPISNILTAFVAYFLYYLIWVVMSLTGILQNDLIWHTLIFMFFNVIAYISVSLAVFNLIPIPPFDGSRILFTLLPQKYYFKIMQYERYIFMVFFLFLIVDNWLERNYSFSFLSLILDPIIDFVLYCISNLAFLPFKLLLGVLT